MWRRKKRILSDLQIPLDNLQTKVLDQWLSEPEKTESWEFGVNVTSALSDTQKALLEQFYVENCSCREIAQQMGLNEATVRKRLSRTRQELQTRLREGEKDMNAMIAVSAIYALLSASVWAGTFRDNFGNENLDAWRRHRFSSPNAQWFVKAGELVCLSKNEPCVVPSTLITLDEMWRNYQLSVQFKIEHTLFNGGNDCPSVVGIGIHCDDANADSGIYSFFGLGPNLQWDRHWLTNGVAPNWVDVAPIDKITLTEGKWYTARMIANGNDYQMFIDNRKVHEFQTAFPDSGRAALYARNCEVHFDNVIITGDGIPNRNLAVSPDAKLSTTWGRIKRNNNEVR